MVNFVSLVTRSCQSFILCLVLATFSGCSSYPREWKHLSTQPPATGSVAGAWRGTWENDNGSHGGKLWCILTPETNAMYEARFRATWMKVMHFTYTAHFEMKPHDIGWEFDGEANLGKLGGTYYYEGRATTTNIVSTYKSKYDNGRFEMKRPSHQVER